MRLLHFDNSGKLTRTVFDNEIPPYAILSHTWDVDEFLYEDLVNETGKNKIGYKKIQFCGKQAASDDLQYFWVDTCCIDKWNLNELSHAINSMFRFYQNAVKCYTLLPDVSEDNKIDESVDKTPWEVDFQRSRWFTRGWTLQELIAPMSVEFFSSSHQLLGDKKSLEQQIQKITNIPVEALRGNPLSSFSIEDRMSWTKNRETTEEEDSAYCLLGIFNVKMPLIYGEGREQALYRLRKDVESESVEQTPFIVPLNRNTEFTGREVQLTELEDLLLKPDTAKIAIVGAGGIGKTQLVLELAYRTRQNYKDCSLLWIPATDIESLNQAYKQITQRLNIPGWDDEKSDAKKLVQRHLSKESTGSWLLIFDNVDDIGLWTVGPESRVGAIDLVDYLPRSNHGCIAFTTRDRAIARHFASQTVIEVPTMDHEIGQMMLQKYLVNRNLTQEQKEMKELLRELNYLPMAIVLAAAYINVNKMAIKDYLNILLSEQSDSHVRALSQDLNDEWQSHTGRHPLIATWLVSFEQIRSRDTLAANYLSFLACVDIRDIPLSLLPTNSTHKKNRNAINTLTTYSMIIKRPAGSALDSHQLVHLATRNWLQTQDSLGLWTEKAIARVLEVFPAVRPWNRSKWRRLLPHANYLLKSGAIEQGNKARDALVRQCAISLSSDGRYNEAEPYFLEGLQSKKKLLGAEHLDTLTRMDSLALNYNHQRAMEEG
jgi:hypothetical protein